MFLPDPLVSLPNLISTLQDSHSISGLGVNLAKCSALPINIPPHISTSIKDSFGITLTDNSLQCLGVPLAPSLRARYNANYPQAFLKTKQWLQLWSTFSIPLLGRITAIKMSNLPKLLYFFRALPLYVSHQTWSREPITNSFGKVNPPDMVNYSHIDPFHRED